MDENGRSPLDGIRRGAERMRHGRTHPADSPLRGLGAFGVVGWSIALPTVGGALLGLWLDRVAPQTFGWTLTLILAGLVVGVVVAWDWVARENRRARAERPRADRADQAEAPRD